MADSEIEGDPAAEHDEGANRHEALERRADDAADERSAADEKRRREDRRARDEQHCPDGQADDQLFCERILQGEQNVGDERQPDSQQKGSRPSIAQAKKHASIRSESMALAEPRDALWARFPAPPAS